MNDNDLKTAMENINAARMKMHLAEEAYRYSVAEYNMVVDAVVDNIKMKVKP
jgi:hypothetical protein